MPPVDPPPSPPPSPPAPPPLPPSADESKRFADLFSGIQFPDKFRKDGRPDLAALVTSYGELETRFNTKTEELKKQIADEAAKDRPKAAADYKVPEIKGVDPKELADHPMLAWWRDEAFAAGLGQERFDKAVAAYIDRMQPQPVPDETLRRELGDSFKQRISAVDAWAHKTAADAGELEALRRVGTDPAGIRIMERLAGLSGARAADGAPAPDAALTIEDLRSMQQDPRYWDAARRDPAWVKKVEDGYKKLYPERKAG